MTETELMLIAAAASIELILQASLSGTETLRQRGMDHRDRN